MRTRILNVAVSVLIPALFASSLLVAPLLAAAALASPDIRWHYYLGSESTWQAEIRWAEARFQGFLAELHELRSQQAGPGGQQ